MQNRIFLVATVAAAPFIVSCQSTSNTSAEVASTAAAVPGTASTALVATEAAGGSTSLQCPNTIAGGPPPKPQKGADFAQNAVGKNIGRNVARNSITNIGGRIGGGLGAAVAGGLASNAIRTEQDLKGEWTVTDGAPDCGCSLDFSSGVNLKMESSNQGSLKAGVCRTMIGSAARWKLGHSFTGYDAKLELLANDRKTVVATLNRDGINYFSGTLADGTPVTMWRRGG